MNRLFGAGAIPRKGLVGGGWEGGTGRGRRPSGAVADYGKRLTLVKCEPFVWRVHPFPLGGGGLGGNLSGSPPGGRHNGPVADFFLLFFEFFFD